MRLRLLLQIAAMSIGLTALALGQEMDGAAATIVRPSPPANFIKPATVPHLAAARKAAGREFVSALSLCNLALPEGQKLAIPTAAELRAAGGVAGKPPAAAKVFDNLYYLGLRQVSAWAVDTPDGIILIDALNNQGDIEQAVEGGLRALGLDPARIRYILITHGHPDHYGGAQYLVDKYQARVLMSEVDWKLAAAFSGQPSPQNFGPAPKTDLIASDGQKFTLGGETLSFVVTPGHTPGTISLLIPVTDHGKRHVVALWGGTGFNFQPSEARFQQYYDSAMRFQTLALAAGADVILSNHPENDNSIKLNDAVAHRGAQDPHPYVVGKSGVQRFLTAYGECAQTFKSQMAP